MWVRVSAVARPEGLIARGPDLYGAIGEVRMGTCTRPLRTVRLVLVD